MNIVEFARALNLSTGTVSRALNDRPEISPHTRQRVLEKARELGYTPNPHARRLVTGKTFLIRLDCPHNSHILSDLFLVQLARAVEEAVGAHGYDLLLRLGAKHHPSILSDYKTVDGLILVASPQTRAEDIRALTHRGKIPATVICGPEPLAFPDCAYVCLETLTGVREALCLLARQGHRRVGYIGSAQVGCRVRAAFPELMAAAGMAWDEALAVEAGVSHTDGYQAAARLLQRRQPPTALFARTDVLALGALQAAQGLGKAVPDAVAVVGHDDIELAALAAPPLTTVGIDFSEVGRIATTALLDMLKRQAAPEVHTVHAHLVVRQSTGARLATRPRRPISPDHRPMPV